MRSLNTDIAQNRLVRILQTKGISDLRVLDAFRKVPRHLFVDGAMFASAYDDNALPIGDAQTISQPSIVAFMTQSLNLTTDDKILEIGTGSGFQAAILAQFSRRVFTIERNRELGDQARKKLRDMGYQNISFKVGDGTLGWPQFAPFNKIIVTAGAPVVPQSLLSQLADGGRMIIPTGEKTQQKLLVYDRQGTTVIESTVADVSFVPLIGNEGWSQ